MTRFPEADYTRPGAAPYRGWPDDIVKRLTKMSLTLAQARDVVARRAADMTRHRQDRSMSPSDEGSAGRGFIARREIVAISGPLQWQRLDAHPAIMAWTTASGRHVVTVGLKRSRWAATQAQPFSYYHLGDGLCVAFPDACTLISLRQWGNPTVLRVGRSAGDRGELTPLYVPGDAEPELPETPTSTPNTVTAARPPVSIDGEPPIAVKRIPVLMQTDSGLAWITTGEALRDLPGALRVAVPIPSTAGLAAAGALAWIINRKLRGPR